MRGNGDNASISSANLIIDSADLSEEETNMRRATHKAIEAITEDLSGDIQLNTAISELMKLSNSLSGKLDKVRTEVAAEALSVLVRLMAPFAPHLAEEFWLKLHGHGSIHQQSWPVLDPSALVLETIDLVIQVKGKVRGTIQVPANADKTALEELALKSDIAVKWLEGQPPRRVIIVPGKLVNLVP